MTIPVEYIALWTLGCAIVAAIAGHYGYARITWFLLSAFLFSPLIAAIVLLVMGPNDKVRPRPAGGSRTGPGI